MLINCTAYTKGNKIGSIDIESISDHLQKPESFVWVELFEPTHTELLKMQEEFNLHELAVEDASHGHQRPKIEEYGDNLFAVMHLVENNLADGNFTLGELAIFVGENYILTVISRAKQDLKVVRNRCEREPHLIDQGSGFVFYAIMDAIVDRYFPLVDELVYEIEKIEDRVFQKTSSRAIIEELYDLKHKTMVLKHAVQPLLEAVGKLCGGRVPNVCRNTIEYYRDVYDHLLRINSTIVDLHDMIATVMQINFSMVSIENNEISKKLSAWAAIFAVITAFAGIWGMNFQFMPELNFKYGYPLALIAILVTSLLLFRRFKRSGWL